MKQFPKVILHAGKERSLKLFHPWVFSGAIATVEDNPAEGDIVEVFTAKGEYLATGHFHNGSIKVRLFSFTRTDAGESFWNDKLAAAFLFRKNIGLIDNKHTEIYRLVHAEGDGLPGLIIDIYGTVAVIQTHTLGMHRVKPFLLSALKEIYGSKLESVYDKSADTMGKQGVEKIENGFLYGEKESGSFKENDLQFHVNWVEGQKTGFFIDQRENRNLLMKYSSGKKVLNTFAYSGGFSMYALKGGATYVQSIDSSKKAAELSDLNARLNGFEKNHSSLTIDAFDFLKKTDEKYDIVILDPPAFAKHLSSAGNAMIGYRNLNTEGIKKVSAGGMLFTFSCSQVIDKTLFRKLIFQAAAQAKRNVRIIYQLTQSPDHPVSIYHPEGEYLKGLVLVID
jgi:23S rRNA (cytosine1962-C5)-methyltransferase